MMYSVPASSPVRIVEIAGGKTERVVALSQDVVPLLLYSTWYWEMARSLWGVVQVTLRAGAWDSTVLVNVTLPTLEGAARKVAQYSFLYRHTYVNAILGHSIYLIRVLSRNVLLGGKMVRGNCALGRGLGLPPRRMLAYLYPNTSIRQCLLTGKNFLNAVTLNCNWENLRGMGKLKCLGEKLPPPTHTHSRLNPDNIFTFLWCFATCTVYMYSYIAHLQWKQQNNYIARILYVYYVYYIYLLHVWMHHITVDDIYILTFRCYACLLYTPLSCSNFRHCSHSNSVLSARIQCSQNNSSCRRWAYDGDLTTPKSSPTSSVLHLVLRDVQVTLGRGPGH